jgi:hypothetical protein
MPSVEPANKRLHLTTAHWQDGRAVAGEARRSADKLMMHKMCRKVRSVVAAVVLLASSGCGHVRPLSNAYAGIEMPLGDRCSFGATKDDGSCVLYEVSLVELLAIPKKFHHKRVSVVGFATLRFEGNTICINEHYGTGCLWLDIEGVEDPGFRKGWAVVEGRFDGENRGHMGCCAGTIDNISVLRRWHY